MATTLTLVGARARRHAVHACDRSIALRPNDLLVGTEAGIREVRNNSVETPMWAAAFDGRFISAIAPLRPACDRHIDTLDAGFGLLADGQADSAHEIGRLAQRQRLGISCRQRLDVRMSGIDGVYRLPMESLPGAGHDTAHTLNAQMILSASGREPGSQRVRCCNGGASARIALDNASIWLPTISGALRLDTQSIMAQSEPPSVVIEGLRNDGHVVSRRCARSCATTERKPRHRNPLHRLELPRSARPAFSLSDSKATTKTGSKPAHDASRSTRTCRPAITVSTCSVMQPEGGIGGDGALSLSELQPRWYEIALGANRGRDSRGTYGDPRDRGCYCGFRRIISGSDSNAWSDWSKNARKR